MAERQINVRLRAITDQYQGAMGKASSTTKQFGRDVSTAAKMGGQDMQSLGRGMVVAGAAVAVAFGAAVNTSMKFEKEMSNVAAVSGATASQMDALSGAAIAAGASTKLAGVTAQDAAASQAELVRAGVSVSDVMGGALMGSLTLAAAGQLDFADAATIAAQAMNIFDLAGSDVTHIADVLAAAANKSATDVGQLGDALRQGGLVAAQTGLSLEETTGALAAFGDSALVGSDAGTSLKTMLQRLIPQSEEAANLMSQLGFEVFDAQGNFIGLEGLAGELRSSLGDLTVEQRASAMSTLFGSDAVRGANVLYEQGAAGIAGYIAAVNDEGAAARMAAIQNDNLKGDIEALGGVMESVFIETGSQANGALRGLVQTTTDVVSGFASMSDGMRGGAAVVVGLTGAVGLLGGGFILLAPKVMAAKTALIDMKGPAAAVGRNMGTIGRAMGVATAAMTLFAIGMQRQGAAIARGRDEADRFIASMRDMSTLSPGDAGAELERLETATADAADEWERLNGWSIAGFNVNLGSSAAEMNEAQGRAEGLADGLAAAQVESANMAITLSYMGAELGISEAELRRLAVTAGVDLRGNVGEATTALREAFDAMAGGLTDAQRLNLTLEEQADASEAQAEAAELAAQAIIDANTAIGDSFGAFTDPLSAYESGLARKGDIERASAEATAAATEDSGDSWEDYYDEQSLSMAEYIAEMQAQVDAQDNWATNLATIAQRGREDVALQMAAMGPESAAAAALMAGAVDAEFQIGADLWVQTTGDGGLAAGEALDLELRAMAEIARADGELTARELADGLGTGIPEVVRIAGEIGANLAAPIAIAVTGMQEGVSAFMLGGGEGGDGLIGMLGRGGREGKAALMAQLAGLPGDVRTVLDNAATEAARSLEVTQVIARDGGRNTASNLRSELAGIPNDTGTVIDQATGRLSLGLYGSMVPTAGSGGQVTRETLRRAMSGIPDDTGNILNQSTGRLSSGLYGSMVPVARGGSTAVAAGVTGPLGSATAQVDKIAAGYVAAMVRQINPFLGGIGRPQISWNASPKLLATGGRVDGVGDGDTVPALLTPGEFVVRKAAVATLGVDALEWINQADRRPPPGFAVGGLVLPQPPDVSGYGSMVGRSGAEGMQFAHGAGTAFGVEASAAAAKAAAAAAAAAAPVGGPAMAGSANGLNPAFAATFAKYNEALGGILRIVSGFRTRASQERLYARWMARVPGQAPAAPPGRSNHERGLAIDHAPHSNASMRAKAGSMGLRYPMSYEPWHVEPVNIRDQGGPLMPGLTYNGTGRPETVVPHDSFVAKSMSNTVQIDMRGATIVGVADFESRMNDAVDRGFAEFAGRIGRA